MKNILITYALPKEGAVAKDYYKNNQTADCSFHFLELGIGIHQSILTLSENLSKNKYDFVLNIGVCGYTGTKSSCIQIARTVHLASNKELLVPVFFKHTTLASIICSDTIVYDPGLVSKLGHVDMESYGVEKVCDYYRVPRIILKVPIDRVGEETKSFNIPQACKTLKKNINFPVLTSQILRYLDSLAPQEDLSSYKDALGLSATQNIIFIKYVHAYNSLSDTHFTTFYNKYSHLDAKNFLSKLEQEINIYKNRLG